MLDSLRVRIAQEDDVDAVASIEALAFKTDWIGRERLKSTISLQNSRVLVAEIGEKIVGFCILGFRERKSSASLRTIAVLTRGLGVGTALLDAAEGVVARRGCRSLRLEVREDNRSAVNFYQKAGFYEIGRKPNYYADGITAIRMHKWVSLNGFRRPWHVFERLIFAVSMMFRRWR